MIPAEEQHTPKDRLSVYSFKKETQDEIVSLCHQLETTETTDINIAKLQNKIILKRELLINLSRLE